MDNFSVDKAKYFQEHGINADIAKGDILAPKKVKAKDVLFGSKTDKLVNNMSDIFPQSKSNNNDNTL